MSFDDAFRAAQADQKEIAQILASDQPWDVAYAQLEPIVRNVLTCWDAPPDRGVSTTSLAVVLQNSPTPQLKQRIFRALFALARHGLADCVTKGKPLIRFGQTKTPWLWHRHIPGAQDSTLPRDDVNEPTWEAYKDSILGRLSSLEGRVATLEGNHNALQT